MKLSLSSNKLIDISWLLSLNLWSGSARRYEHFHRRVPERGGAVFNHNVPLAPCAIARVTHSCACGKFRSLVPRPLIYVLPINKWLILRYFSCSSTVGNSTGLDLVGVDIDLGRCFGNHWTASTPTVHLSMQALSSALPPHSTLPQSQS